MYCEGSINNQSDTICRVVAENSTLIPANSEIIVRGILPIRKVKEGLE